MAARYDLMIEQGATFPLPLAIQNPDGTPFDLTHWIGTAQIRKFHHSDDVIKDFTVSIPGVPPDPTAGLIQLVLTDEDTGSILAGENIADPRSQYVWDFIITNTLTTEVKRLLEGFVIISPRVTR
jgi:hypothetical protein